MVQLGIVGRIRDGRTRQDPRNVVHCFSVVLLRLHRSFGLSCVDAELRSQVRCASVDELSMVDTDPGFSVLNCVFSELECGGIVRHGRLLCLDGISRLVFGLGSLVDEVLAHSNGRGSILLVKLPAFLQT